MQALKAIGVEYVVAPYEADAQMAHMALTGQVQGVITEDSDLLAYGCPKVHLPTTYVLLCSSCQRHSACLHAA